MQKHFFSQVFIISLKGTFGKRFQVRFHWNTGYNNAPEVKDDLFDITDCRFDLL